MDHEPLDNNKMSSYPDLPGREGSESFYHSQQSNPLPHDDDHHHNHENLERHDMSAADELKLRMAAQLSREVQPATNGEQEEPEDVHATNSEYSLHRPQEFASQEEYDKHMMSQHQMQHMAQHPLQQYGQQIVQYPPHEVPNQFSPAPDETVSGRKKKKTSRACDECRRKKVRCDARDDAEGTVCSNCKRSGAPCSFSRQPLKRGPSKGYIKDLSDRLQAVEGVVNPLGQIDERTASHNHTVNSNTDRKRKRGVSNVPDDFAGYQPPLTMPSGEPQDLDIVANNNHEQYTPDGVAIRPEWAQIPERPMLGSPQAEQSHGIKLELDKDALQRYYIAIHPFLPFLPHSKGALALQLQSSTSELRESFLAALGGFPRKAWVLLNVELDETHGFTRAENLLAVQILLLITIDASNTGPEGSQLAKRALATAAATAAEASLHINRCDESIIAMSDEETDELMARRIWWSLVVLDRFTASSTDSARLVDDMATTMLPIERRIVGKDLHHMYELSRILAKTSAFNAAQKQASTSDGVQIDSVMTAIARSTLYDGLETFQLNAFSRDTREQYVPALILTAAYWYAQALLGESDTANGSMRTYQAAQSMFAILSNQSYRTSPLDYLFKLCILRTFLAMRGEAPTEVDLALKALRDLCDSGIRWDTIIQQEIDGILPERTATTDQNVSNHGLQHLAELATAEDGSRNDFDDRGGDTGLSRALQEASQNAEREAQEAARDSYINNGMA